MNIRLLERTDIPLCVDIYNLNYPNDELYWIDLLNNELNAMFQDSKFIIPKYFVIEIDNKIIGFAGYSNCGFDTEVFGLLWCNVHPDYQGKGVGKMLVEERLKHIKGDGGKIVLSSQRGKVTWHLERFGFVNMGDNGECDGDKYYLMRLKM